MGASAGVVGAGIYGITAALELRHLGLDVTLYDKRYGLLGEATSRNFFRLHRGYHYPRSQSTAIQARDGYDAFVQAFPTAVAKPGPRYYAIASEDSLTSASQFTAHCRKLGLRCDPAVFPGMVSGSLEACFEADESYYHPDLLWQEAWAHLKGSGVRLELGRAARRRMRHDHDVVVVAAYAGLNEALLQLGCQLQTLQYELCEVAVIEAPKLRDLSLVVMDGAFCSLAPYCCGLSILYDVEHSVHRRATGQRNPLTGYDVGEKSNFPAMLGSLRRFVDPGEVRLVNSLVADRVVLPGADATDERPAGMWWAAPNILAVLSGKVTASVTTAQRIAQMVAQQLSLPEPGMAETS